MNRYPVILRQILPEIGRFTAYRTAMPPIIEAFLPFSFSECGRKCSLFSAPPICRDNLERTKANAIFFIILAVTRLTFYLQSISALPSVEILLSCRKYLFASSAALEPDR